MTDHEQKVFDHALLIQELYTAFLEFDLASLQILLHPEILLHIWFEQQAQSYTGYNAVLQSWMQLHQKAKKLEPSLEQVISARQTVMVRGKASVAANTGQQIYRFFCVLTLHTGRLSNIWVFLDIEGTIE